MEKLGVYKQAVKDAEEKAGGKRTVTENSVLFEYPDYETYREIQTAGNKQKLKKQFVKESHVELLANHINEALGDVSFGLCHGTRSGREQSWFNSHLQGTPKIIGTEISDTANQFENTVEWDFHESNPDWVGKADFVYSNSWDHAFDPVKAFSTWIESLRPGGLLLLDYTKGQTPSAANALDPFGITYEGLVSLLEDNFSERGAVLEGLNFKKNKEYRALVVRFQKASS